MNITDQISNEIGGKLGNQIKTATEIQFYVNETISGYQWRDGRFIETCDVWANESFASSDDLIKHVKEHLDRNPINQ